MSQAYVLSSPGLLEDRRRNDRAVAIWLLAVAAMIFAMVVIGGVTRLTESGLSITEWKPVSGVIPPLDEGAWQREFELYKKIPEFQKAAPGHAPRGVQGNLLGGICSRAVGPADRRRLRVAGVLAAVARAHQAGAAPPPRRALRPRRASGSARLVHGRERPQPAHR